MQGLRLNQTSQGKIVTANVANNRYLRLSNSYTQLMSINQIRTYSNLCLNYTLECLLHSSNDHTGIEDRDLQTDDM